MFVELLRDYGLKYGKRYWPVAAAYEAWQLMNQSVDAMDSHVSIKKMMPPNDQFKLKLDGALGIDPQQSRYGSDYRYYYLHDADAALRGLRHLDAGSLFVVSVDFGALFQDFFVLFIGQQSSQIPPERIQASLIRRGKLSTEKDTEAFWKAFWRVWDADRRVWDRAGRNIPKGA